jgi:hypothetical protein
MVFLTAKKSVTISTILRVVTGPHVIYHMPVINVEVQDILLLLVPVLDNPLTLLVQKQHKQQNLLLAKTQKISITINDWPWKILI